MITALDDQGLAGTAALEVYRQLESPDIQNVQFSEDQIGVYEKFEVRFDLVTVADYVLFPHDPDPPDGVEPGIGVTVEGIFTSPSGHVFRHPAFFLVGGRIAG